MMKVGLKHELPAPNAPTWRCREPTAPWSHFPLGQGFGSQMTAAFPAAAIASILLEKKRLVFTPNDVVRKFLQIETARIENALDTSWGAQWRTGAWRSDVSAEYGCNTMLKFLILVQSYVQVATREASTLDNDLKKKTPIMPRTEFLKMLRLVTDLMTPKAAAAFATESPQALPVLTPLMGELNTHLDSEKWFWNRGNRTKVRLPVKKCPQALCAQPGKDLIAVNDKDARNGQIGGSGNKVKRMIGQKGEVNALLWPILEFRSLGNFDWIQVAPQAPEMFHNPQDHVN